MANDKSLYGIFKVMTANEAMDAAKSIKTPRKFWKEFWIEDEVCCLFADSNVGKSILAVQIAEHVANMLDDGESVLYYDFELSGKQFQMRYIGDDGGQYVFSDKLIRVELDTDKVRECSNRFKMPLDELITQGIEDNISRYGSKAIIVDNISWLTNMKSTSSTAGKLMLKLCELKRKYHISILVLAHTPKRNLSKPITQNNLSGSKSLTNFFDAMFAIGKSITDPSLRYVKQIKVRSGSFKYDSNNVETCSIEKMGAFLGFRHIGYASETELLKQTKSKQSAPKTKNKKATPQQRNGRAKGKRMTDNIKEMALVAYRRAKESS